jgi:hypothetical protein
MRISALFVVLVGIAAPHAWAGEKVTDTPRGRAEAFLARLGKGDVAAAYDELFAGSPLVAEKPQAVDAVKRQTEAGLPLYGKSIGFELHNEKTFGDSIVRLTYIQRFEKHPLVWRFWFYRPAGNWYLDNVVFNDQYGFLQGE